LPETNQPLRRTSLEPVLWSCLLYLCGLAFMFYYFYPRFTNSPVGEALQPIQASLSIGPILIYFFSVVIVMGIILWIIPVSKLKLLLRIVFAILYVWGIVIITQINLPIAAAISLGAVAALLWLFFPLVILQDILLLLTLVAVGVVFGTLVSPWTVVWVLLALSIYDVVAVRLGYMMWLAKKLSESDTLPAFIVPKKSRDWNLNLKGETVTKLFEEESAEREFSLLGGGDLGFPLVFVASVYGAYGYYSAMVVAGASIAGLILAYLIQIYILKGKPLPALPPISFMAFLGFLAVYLTH
jgi:presenilin-like A22 family membrane protease